MPRPLEPLAERLPRPAVNAVKRALGRALSWNLNALAVIWATDKRKGYHGYTTHYGRHLRSRRKTTEHVLEVGIGGYDELHSGGNSLRMWRDYFPRATIYGLDIYEKRMSGEPRIVAMQADQSDPDSLRGVVDACPSTFDLIVDDGSHVGEHINTAFEVLFPALTPGGMYVIEDCQGAYDAYYGGGPPGTTDTAISLAKSLLDDLNVGPLPVAAVHAYPGIVFIEKASAQAASPQPCA